MSFATRITKVFLLFVIFYTLGIFVLLIPEDRYTKILDHIPNIYKDYHDLKLDSVWSLSQKKSKHQDDLFNAYHEIGHLPSTLSKEQSHAFNALKEADTFYTVTIATLKDRSEAIDLVKHLKRIPNLSSSFFAPVFEDDHLFFKIRTGIYPTKIEAEHAKSQWSSLSSRVDIAFMPKTTDGLIESL